MYVCYNNYYNCYTEIILQLTLQVLPRVHSSKRSVKNSFLAAMGGARNCLVPTRCCSSHYFNCT